MARYYFHLRSPYEVLHDQVGMMLPDVSHLTEEAEHVAYTVRKLLGPDDWERGGTWMINVMDDAGVGQFTYPLRMARECEDIKVASSRGGDKPKSKAVGVGRCSGREKRRAGPVPLRAEDRWKHRLPKPRQ